MPTFDPEKKHTAVGGRPGVAFMQEGYAFNGAHECLGKCNAQGEVEQKKAPTKPAPAKAPEKTQGDVEQKKEDA